MLFYAILIMQHGENGKFPFMDMFHKWRSSTLCHNAFGVDKKKERQESGLCTKERERDEGGSEFYYETCNWFIFFLNSFCSFFFFFLMIANRSSSSSESSSVVEDES